jgi:Flp pilus assembly protein CpaB
MRKLNASIVIGIIVAIIGAISVVAYGRNVDRRLSSGKQPTAVLVADSTLAAGSTVDDVRGHVHVTQVPAAFVVADALHALTDIPASQVLTSVVVKGGQLSRASFGDPATVGRLSPAAGHVALAVETDLSPGVARYLSPGQLVDVFVTYHDVMSDGGKHSFASSRTKLFVSGAKVLAVSVAQSHTTKTSHSTFGSTTDQAQPQDKVVAVLDLRPADAERLVNADILGSIYLAYTATGGDHTSTGVTPDDVVRSNR